MQAGSSLDSFVFGVHACVLSFLTGQQASVIGSLTARKHGLHEDAHLALGRVASAHNAETERLAAGSLIEVHRQIDAFLKAWTIFKTSGIVD